MLAKRIVTAATPTTWVIGLGKTGLSLARFLATRGEAFAVADSRAEPPELAALQAELPAVPVHTGPFDVGLFAGAEQLWVSPGVPMTTPAIAQAQAQGAAVGTDIELFAYHARAPVVGVTGSNGKSTVTALVAAMAQTAGQDCRMGGNIGTPVLALLDDEEPDLYVLELSSFQLEGVSALNPAAAVVLNVSADHMDRYANLDAYAEAKSRVYQGDGAMVINADDARVAAMADPRRRVLRFAVDRKADFGLGEHQGAPWLFAAERPVLAASALPMVGQHNRANALAALALGSAVGLPTDAMTTALKTFPGLPHRSQWLGEWHGVGWYNDSKATNVGATQAALAGLPGPVVLIAGGDGKGADFSALRPTVAAKARGVVLLGRDAPTLARVLAGTVPLIEVPDMPAAVEAAAGLARPGDSVLLSPACASLDMFSGYEERGRVFIKAVEHWHR